MRDGYIYAIADECGPIKIGFSTTPGEKRLKALQIGNPAPLTLLAAVPGTVTQEKLLHRALSNSHLVGEWFKPDGAVARIVAAMRGGYLPEEFATGMSPFPPTREALRKICDDRVSQLFKRAEFQLKGDTGNRLHQGAHLLAELAFVGTPRVLASRYGPVSQETILMARQEFENALWDVAYQGGSPFCEVVHDLRRIPLARRTATDMICRGERGRWSTKTVRWNYRPSENHAPTPKNPFTANLPKRPDLP